MATRTPANGDGAAPPSLLVSRVELDFLLFDWLDVEGLATRARFADLDRASAEAVLDLAETLAEREFRPAYQVGDRDEPRIMDGRVVLPDATVRAYGALRASGLLAATRDHAIGGLQLPYTLERACMAYLMAANTGAVGYQFLSMANAALIEAHGSADQVERFARPQVDGRFTGTMCLSEPGAGSSLSDIETRAVRQDDGRYRVFGSKMWISGGDHELAETIVHLVLAKTPEGISLLIVPKHLVDESGAPGERNDVTLVGLNHKMGFRAITNCALAFGDGGHAPGGEPGAIGELVGEPGQGLRQMFHMMNEARIGVGLGAAALASTGYLHSLEYARTRRQGRLPGRRDGGQVRLVEHADVRHMLLAQKCYAEAGLALCLYCARLVDERDTAPDGADRAAADRRLGLLTPVAKSWPSKFGLKANDLAIQVLGGCGYTRDFPVE